MRLSCSHMGTTIDLMLVKTVVLSLCVPDGGMFSIWSKVRSLGSKNAGSAIIVVTFTILFTASLGSTYAVIATCKALFFIHNSFLILAQIFSLHFFCYKNITLLKPIIIEEFIDWI